MLVAKVNSCFTVFCFSWWQQKVADDSVQLKCNWQTLGVFYNAYFCPKHLLLWDAKCIHTETVHYPRTKKAPEIECGTIHTSLQHLTMVWRNWSQILLKWLQVKIMASTKMTAHNFGQHSTVKIIAPHNKCTAKRKLWKIWNTAPVSNSGRLEFH